MSTRMNVAVGIWSWIEFKTYNHALQQKLSSLTTNYIQFERPFKYMKECPPKDYRWLIEIIESYVDQLFDKYNKKIIVLVGSGCAQIEVHSNNLYVCLDIDKRALYCAKFAMKYLFRKKSNVIVQHYNIKEGLLFLLHKIHRHIPSSVEIVVLFQHPSPRNNPVVRDVLIQGAMSCYKMCIRKIVSNTLCIWLAHQ